MRSIGEAPGLFPTAHTTTKTMRVNSLTRAQPPTNSASPPPKFARVKISPKMQRNYRMLSASLVGFLLHPPNPLEFATIPPAENSEQVHWHYSYAASFAKVFIRRGKSTDVSCMSVGIVLFGIFAIASQSFCDKPRLQIYTPMETISPQAGILEDAMSSRYPRRQV